MSIAATSIPPPRTAPPPALESTSLALLRATGAVVTLLTAVLTVEAAWPSPHVAAVSVALPLLAFVSLLYLAWQQSVTAERLRRAERRARYLQVLLSEGLA